MHEFSLALGLVERLKELAQKHKAKQIDKVYIKWGKLSGVVIDSFIFSFNLIKEEYPILKNCEIVVNEEPITYKCLNCNFVFEKEDFKFPKCPKCDSIQVKQIKGDAFLIEKVEMEVDDEDKKC